MTGIFSTTEMVATILREQSLIGVHIPNRDTITGFKRGQQRLTEAITQSLSLNQEQTKSLSKEMKHIGFWELDFLAPVVYAYLVHKKTDQLSDIQQKFMAVYQMNRYDLYLLPSQGADQPEIKQAIHLKNRMDQLLFENLENLFNQDTDDYRLIQSPERAEQQQLLDSMPLTIELADLIAPIKQFNAVLHKYPDLVMADLEAFSKDFAWVDAGTQLAGTADYWQKQMEGFLHEPVSLFQLSLQEDSNRTYADSLSTDLLANALFYVLREARKNQQESVISLLVAIFMREIIKNTYQWYVISANQDRNTLKELMNLLEKGDFSEKTRALFVKSYATIWD